MEDTATAPVLLKYSDSLLLSRLPSLRLRVQDDAPLGEIAHVEVLRADVAALVIKDKILGVQPEAVAVRPQTAAVIGRVAQVAEAQVLLDHFAQPESAA